MTSAEHDSPVAWSSALIILALGFAFIAFLWQAVTAPQQLTPVVEGWSIEALDDVVVWGDGDGVRLVGDFECVDGYDPEVAIQFQAALALETGGTVPAFVGPKVAAGRVCDGGPTEFVVRWDNLPAGFVLKHDDAARVRYSASPDGHTIATAETDPFTILTP